MPRRSRKRDYTAPHEPLDVESATRGWARSESRPDGDWRVRSVAGSDKTYRCPGCDQLIAPGTGHIVAWRADGLMGLESAIEDRRHWHTSCWQLGRRPSRRR